MWEIKPVTSAPPPIFYTPRSLNSTSFFSIEKNVYLLFLSLHLGSGFFFCLGATFIFPSISVSFLFRQKKCETSSSHGKERCVRTSIARLRQKSPVSNLKLGQKDLLSRKKDCETNKCRWKEDRAAGGSGKFG